jgi:branched-chain amino acid transport system ATP-binding protein
MSTQPPILEVDLLTKSFGGVLAVHDCTLSVAKGTITGLIGPNGAGKTTLFNLIAGAEKPTSGAIRFQDRRIDGLPPHRVFHEGIVRTFQIPRSIATMTVLENLMLMPPDQSGEHVWNPWLFGGRVSREEEQHFERAMEVLNFVDLVDLRDEYASSLSGGQKKLLELARALMCDPALLLLDEPGAGVNRVLLQKLAEKIEALRSDLGITIFLIEHDMDLASWMPIWAGNTDDRSLGSQRCHSGLWRGGNPPWRFDHRERRRNGSRHRSQRRRKVHAP